ncbi:MAG: ABC transporter ATP-binding protein [Rhodospirillales bacterium 70-18]|nr:ABC transporter ATP-binding protein [Rhodospirillales bacterium]OJY74257.1 MAG: ABC transporter ATP-binding protein [Rhodospirillales bacterium 70-18]
MSKLSLHGLGKTFGRSVAVADVDLALAPGEFVSLLGPSGCGKTTTLRMIAGFMKPTAGRIAMNGGTISDPSDMVPPEKRGMSMIFQSYAIWPNMTVGENVAFGLKLRKLPTAEVKRRLDKILAVVRLDHLVDRYPAELSGGQQQRVALARAIVIEPEVLLLDEPLSNLDASLREEMRSEIRRLHDEFRITTVYVTHDQSEAMVTSDRIVVMNHGRIEQVADPVSLYNRPRTRFVAGFIGRTNFLDGRLQGDTLVFPGFTVPAARVPDAAALPAEVSFSLRPHDVHLHRAPPAGDHAAWRLPGRVVERAFLGEHWDYVVQPDGSSLRLRTTTAPRDVHEAGAPVTIEIDPTRLVAVTGSAE